MPRPQPNGVADEGYSTADVESMLGLSRRIILRLVKAGYVSPQRGKRREYRFGFQDVVALRAAHGLTSLQIPTRKIMRSLKLLAARLPEELPRAGLRITAVGNEIAVKRGASQWQADSGQLLFDFTVESVAGSVAFLKPANKPITATPTPNESAPANALAKTGQPADAHHWFAVGCALENNDATAAIAAYREAIAADPRFVDAYLNLGFLLCELGQCREAVALYRSALRHCRDSASLHYNLAVALDDLGEATASLDAYNNALQYDPALADAHFNIARLHEQLGHRHQAIRHYSAYRRLTKDQR